MNANSELLKALEVVELKYSPLKIMPEPEPTSVNFEEKNNV